MFDEGYRKEGEWPLNIRSVIVFGHVAFVEDKSRAEEICRGIASRFTDDAAYVDAEIARSLSAVQCLELVPEHMSGKLVKES